MGVQLAVVSQHDMLEMYRTSIETNQRGAPEMVMYVNAHCLNTAQDDSIYRKILNEASVVYADGVGAVLAANWLQDRSLTRMTTADWFPQFCQAAAAHNWNIYLLAGKPGVARLAQQKLTSAFPGLKICGTADGYFQEKSEEQVLQEIWSSQPDVLLVGMGIPTQEKWASGWQEALPVKIVWCVGALLDYWAGEEKRAPHLVRKLALEWFWRLLMDPAGKWQRYVIGLPRFAIHLIRLRFEK